MNRNKSLLFAAVLSCSALLAPQAFAQGGPIELQMFRPAMDSKGHFSVDSTQVLGHMKISFGFGVTNAFKPLELSGNGRDFAVNNLVSATLQFAIGLFQHFEVGVGLPFSIVMGQTNPVDDGNPDGRWNQGANPSKVESAPMNYDQQGKFANQGIGDGYFNFKWRILPAAKGPVGLAAMFSMAFPTGNDAAFLGSGGLTLAPKFIVDKRLSRGRMLLSANLGARLRTGGDHILTANAGWDTCNTWTARNGAPCTFDGTMDNNMTQNVSQVNDVTYGLGFTWRLTNKVEFVSEMFGSTELSSLGKDAETRNNPVDGNYTLEYTKKVMPLEALAGLKLYLAASSYLAVGGGVGLTGIAGMDHVGAPDFRLFAVFSFEPFIGDRDGDGIPDDIDKCPDDPEDFDGFQDEDGCPDLDNDKDGIPDSLDKCPNDPETFNNFEDEDGCPDDVTSDRDGDGILDNKDQCPDNPEDFDGFEDEDGCPEEDNDGDGVMDIKDLCPGKDVDKKNSFEMTKEDFDSWQDEDGCPDPDNDGDGLLDKVDKCPNEPETFNGFEDEDGCPDEGKVRVTAGKIEIYEKIYFATNKAEILPESFGILDAIAATLKAHPNILKVEIQGHTDDRNTDEYNLKLSDDRANAVRDYLIDKGIAPSRLIAKGYGESRPIDKRTTEEARAKNRRVEFIILERGDSKSR